MRFQNESNKVAIELRVVQFWSEIILVISDQIAFSHFNYHYKSITNHYIFYIYIIASLVIVVMVSSELFFFQKLHEFNSIQYVAVTQNINTILYDCTL